MKIEEIDRNFKAATIGSEKILFRNACAAPFSVEGFPWRTEGDLTFYRLPRTFTKAQVNEGALWLANQTSGGAIRFRTGSPKIAIRTKLVYSSDMNHMPRAGSAGFDLYRGLGRTSQHVGTAQPERDQREMELILCENPLPGKMADFILNMPLYGGAEAVEIGITPGAKLLPPSPHKIKKPILFYGSSITQGGCASRPGNAYTTRLCRTLDAPQINLGFSGSGCGEIAVAEAIAKLPLAAFVLDYDYNSPDPEHLKATHEPFFRAVREKQPLLPVIILSACNVWKEFNNPARDLRLRRRDIIRKTYENALKSGDKNVCFIDGGELFGKSERSACTVDCCHPNDLGFDRMYRAVLPVLRNALKKA